MTRPRPSILAACTIACAAASAQAQPPAAKVRVDEARLEQRENWREVTGSVRPSRRSRLATQEAGIVLSVAFEEGDRVEAGRVLLKLDDARANYELRRAEAVVTARQALVREREADLEDARRDLRLVEQSAAAGSATTTEVDKARTDVARTEARLAQAQANLTSANAEADLARRRLEDMTIEAPFDGHVVSQDTEVGQWLSEGEPVLEMLALDRVEVWLDVPERYLSRLTSGDGHVRIRIDAVDRQIEAPLTGIVPQVDPLSRLAPVWVRVDNREGLIRPGMSVVGLVPTGRSRQTLTVHKDAILRDDAGEFVYVNAGGTARAARIDRLFAAGNRVAIREGTIQPGAELVIEGNERLAPGQPLNVTDDGAEPPAGDAHSAGGSG